MEPRCSICRHPERAAIDTALLSSQVGTRSGNSMTAIARQFGVSYSTLRRHTPHLELVALDLKEDEMVKEAIGAARDNIVHQANEAERFLQDFEMLRDKGLELLQEAEDLATDNPKKEAEAFNRRLRVMQEIRKQTDLRARVVLQILEIGKQDGISRSEIDAFLADIRAALEEYPEALEAVTFAMRKMAG